MGGGRRRDRPGAQAAGAQVSREFYVNDRGVQIDRFGASLEAAALGQPIPDDGYDGDYIADLAAQVVATKPTIVNLPEGERMAAFREVGYDLQLAQQKAVLDEFGTHFDVWYSERSLHSSGAVERGFERLREMGHMYEAEGAVWLRTTDFGDDKDRPLIKSDGEPTYFASDTAYYVDKRSADSTGASTCSAPTTTATCTGSSRSRPARATSPTSTLRC